MSAVLVSDDKTYQRWDTGEDLPLDFAYLRDRDAYRAFYDEVGLLKDLQVVTYRPDYMIHLLSRLRQNRVLELGAGTGGNLIMLALLKCTCTGVECSRPMVANFRKAEATLPADVRLRVRMIEGMIEDLDLPDRFEWVILTEVLEHVLDPLEVLRVARRHVDTGGSLFITAPAIRVGGPSHIRGVPHGALEGWLGQTGWRATEWRDNLAGKGLGQPYAQTVCFAEAVPCAS